MTLLKQPDATDRLEVNENVALFKPKNLISKIGSSLKSILRPQLPASKTFRYLTRQIEADYPPHEKGRSILITSPEKMQFSTNFTLMLAYTLQQELGSNVLIIDSAMEKKSVTQRLKHETDRGFIELMSVDMAESDEYILETSQQGIHHLPVGQLSQKKHYTLERNRVADLIETVSNKYDYILFQVGHIQNDTRYLLLSQFVDVNYILARENETEMRALNGCIELFTKHQIINVKTILVA